MSSNWVGTDADARPNERLTFPLSKFLVYWTSADIDRKVGLIKDEVKEQTTRGGSVVSRLAGDIAFASHAAFSEVVTGAVSATTSRVMKRPIYYQHLLSARDTRDALRDRPGGLVKNSGRLCRSYLGNFGRTVYCIWGVRR